MKNAIFGDLALSFWLLAYRLDDMEKAWRTFGNAIGRDNRDG